MLELTNAERRRKFWTKHMCQDSEFDCSVLLLKVLKDNFFNALERLLSNGPGSTSIQTRRWYGKVAVEEEVVGVDVWFGLSSATSFFLYILQCNRFGRLRVPPSSPSRICFSQSRSLPKNRFHHQIRIRSWFRFRNGLDNDWLPPQKLDRSSCSHGSILLSRGKVYSRHDPPKLSSSESSRLVMSTVSSPRSSWYLHWSTVWSIENDLDDFANFLLVTLQQVSLHVAIGPRWFIRCRQSCWNNHSFWIVLSNKFPWTFWTTRDFASHFVAHVRYCSVDTEVIDGDDRAKNRFNGFVVATEVKRQFIFPLLFKPSCSKALGSSWVIASRAIPLLTFTDVNNNSI